MPQDDLPSPYWDLIRSSAVPSPEDTHIINGHIRQREDELASVSAEIAQFQKRLRQLNEKEVQLQRFIGCHKSLTSPVRRLPPEILTEIFLLCLAYGGDRVKPSTKAQPSTREAPLLLLQVCVRWRDVALKTPRMWANLVIRGKIAPALLTAWLSRAGTCLLDLQIDGNWLSPSGSPFQLVASPDLVALCRRLRSLTIVELPMLGNHPKRSGPIFPVDLVDTPFLEELRLYLPGIDNLNGDAISFPSAPHLRHFDVSYWSGLNKDRPLPWTQLTNLSLCGQSNILDVLHHCTNIISLKLRDCSMYLNRLPVASHPALLPHLKELCAQDISPVSGLTCLEAPSLQDLKITIDRSQQVLLLPRRCGKHIKSFELLHARQLLTDEVEKGLALMPQLIHLHVEHDDVLRILSRPVDDYPLLPRLQSINFYG